MASGKPDGLWSVGAFMFHVKHGVERTGSGTIRDESGMHAAQQTRTVGKYGFDGGFHVKHGDEVVTAA